jgi:D-alanyl-D-alanine carboxypeptidase
MRLLIFLALLSSVPLRADEIDDYAIKEMERQKSPGLSIAIVKNGKLAKAKGYGLANVELNVPANEQTIFQWASITKQFTGAAIQLLAQEGKLNVDDLLSKYYATAPKAWSNVTLRHLLTHTSGILSYTSVLKFREDPRKDFSGEQVIDFVRDAPLEFMPGDKYKYSNTGYYLLGYVIEKVSGLSYREFLAERIFRPLNMETADFNERSRVVPHRASGYAVSKGTLRNAEFVSPTQPFAAGALIGSVLDLAKWDAALYGEVLLPEKARQEMWTPVKLNNRETFPYGFGWSFGKYRDYSYMAHGGGIQGFATYIARFTDNKLTVIVLMNFEGDAQQIANHIAGMVIDKKNDN